MIGRMRRWRRGKSDFVKSEIRLPELTRLVAGGGELEELAHELERHGDRSTTGAVGRELLEDTKTLG